MSTRPDLLLSLPQCEHLLPGQTEGLLSIPMSPWHQPAAHTSAKACSAWCWIPGERGQPPAQAQRPPQLQDHLADSCRTVLRVACSSSPFAPLLLL